MVMKPRTASSDTGGFLGGFCPHLGMRGRRPLSDPPRLAPSNQEPLLSPCLPAEGRPRRGGSKPSFVRSAWPLPWPHGLRSPRNSRVLCHGIGVGPLLPPRPQLGVSGSRGCEDRAESLGDGGRGPGGLCCVERVLGRGQLQRPSPPAGPVDGLSQAGRAGDAFLSPASYGHHPPGLRGYYGPFFPSGAWRLGARPRDSSRGGPDVRLGLPGPEPRTLCLP